MAFSVLVADGDCELTTWLQRSLGGRGFNVDVASDGPAVAALLRAKQFDLLLLDANMTEPSTHELLTLALRGERARQVIVLSALCTVPEAVRTMQAGAAEVLSKPLDMAALSQALERIMGPTTDVDELTAWRRLYAPAITGEDPALLQVLRMVQRIAPTQCDVLITGASGTGKELIARSVHNGSQRRNGPFVALNCAAIPRDLMESELFGHSRGAFTGATTRRSGKFEAAHGGTLFLDEAGELELSLQGKFLRVLQEREITPIGEARTVAVDVRIVSATNQALESLCKERLFREDLYYRLNVIPIHLPALRDRPGDISILAEHFCERANRRHGRCVKGLTADAQEGLKQHGWPGNVRELQNLIERIVVLKGNDAPISRDDLPSRVLPTQVPSRLEDLRLPENGVDINEALTIVETRLTVDALHRARGNKARAAELLGLKRTTLVERLKKLNLNSAAM